jgi:transposase-like protein
MNDIFEFKTLTEFTDYFQDEATCVKHFTAIRFRDGQYCPHCGYAEVYTFSSGKRYRCASCKQDFTIRTGTIFGDSKLPIRKWFMAIYLLSTTSKGISSVQLAKHLGVTQKTGWFMDHRIRKAMKQNKGQLFGKIEADETFIGGLAKNMHSKKRRQVILGTGSCGKTPVFGMRSRNGEVRAKVVPAVSRVQLHGAIKEHVAPGSIIYTDQWKAYRGLREYKHGVVNHSAREYVRGDCHTNGIESYWALFKRGYHGVYHHMSKKHLQRYVNECAFRLNRRGRSMKAIFSELIQTISESNKLSYKELIA